jgi:hypothetical protein
VKRCDPMVKARVMNQLQKWKKSGQTTEQLENTLKTPQAKILIVLDCTKRKDTLRSPRTACGLWFEGERQMKAQPATQETIQTTLPKCTSGPDCPCEFCVNLCAKHAEGRFGERHRKATRRRLPPLVFSQASLSSIGTHRHHFQGCARWGTLQWVLEQSFGLLLPV